MGLGQLDMVQQSEQLGEYESFQTSTHSTIRFLVEFSFEYSRDCLHCVLIFPFLGLVQSILQVLQTELGGLILLGFELLCASKLLQLRLVQGHLREAINAEASACAFQIAHIAPLARLILLYPTIGVYSLNMDTNARREWYVIVLILATFALRSSHELGVIHVPLVEKEKEFSF